MQEGFEYVGSFDEGVERVLEGNFAFMNSESALRYRIDAEHTDYKGESGLHMARECFVSFRSLTDPLPHQGGAGHAQAVALQGTSGCHHWWELSP